MKKQGESVGGRNTACAEGKNRYNSCKEVLFMLTEKDYKMIEKATLYDLRLIFSTGEKDTYTREEIVELLDKTALAKDQE